MGKFGILFAAILLGILGSMVFFNQGKKSQNIQTNIIPSPTQNPSLSPLTQKPTSSESLIVSPTAIITTPAMSKQTDTAIIKTSKGDITISLYPNDAPNTVANFVSKSKNDFYKNLTFHRVEDWVVQGGDPLGNGTGGGNMPTELNNKPFVIGAVGIARGQDIKISNDSQFFITKKDSQFLNGQYTNFGIVTKGMDVVEKIEIGDKILGITIE